MKSPTKTPSAPEGNLLSRLALLAALATTIPACEPNTNGTQDAADTTGESGEMGDIDYFVGELSACLEQEPTEPGLYLELDPENPLLQDGPLPVIRVDGGESAENEGVFPPDVVPCETPEGFVEWPISLADYGLKPLPLPPTGEVDPNKVAVKLIVSNEGYYLAHQGVDGKDAPLNGLHELPAEGVTRWDIFPVEEAPAAPRDEE